MIKIGTDMLQVSRVQELTEKKNIFEKIFTKNEIAYLKNKMETGEVAGYKYFESVAGIYCAKEAVLKAFGIGISNSAVLKEVEVCHEKSGEPFVCLTGKLKEKFEKMANVEHVCVSVAHDGGFAICSAIIDLKVL